MVFWKKKEPKPEIREIKEAVSAPPAPPLPKMELAPMPERPKFAPLFIKIERYQEVLRSIGSMKLVLASLRELLMLRKELERIKADSDSLLEKNIKEIEAVTGRLDAELRRLFSAIFCVLSASFCDIGATEILASTLISPFSIFASPTFRYCKSNCSSFAKLTACLASLMTGSVTNSIKGMPARLKSTKL